MIDRALTATMPNVRHSAGRAALLSAVLMDYRTLVVCNHGQLRTEFEAAIALLETKFPGRIDRICRAYGNQEITLRGGGEVRFVSPTTSRGLGGAQWNLVLEANV